MDFNQTMEDLGKIGVLDFSHSNQTLRDHLIGTAEKLQSWSCPEHLILAGLCHSIYGTESFKPVAISRDHREHVAQIIGKDSERLVYLFCCHEKDSLWENLQRKSKFSLLDRFTQQTISMDLNTLKDMITLTLGNWLEQRPRVDKKWWCLRQKEFKQSVSYLPNIAYQEFIVAYGIS